MLSERKKERKKKVHGNDFKERVKKDGDS